MMPQGKARISIPPSIRLTDLRPFSNFSPKMNHPGPPRPLPWLLLAAAILACGCTPTPPAEPPATSPPQLVGRIASIPPERKFVLIQSYGPWNIPIGTILTTRGEENRTANLLFTGEKLGHFAAADIQSGTVETGDAVYSRHTPKPATYLTTIPEPPESPEPTPEEAPPLDTPLEASPPPQP